MFYNVFRRSVLEIGPVLASKTTTIWFNQFIGQRIRKVNIKHTNGADDTAAKAATNLNEIRWMVNGKPKRTCSGTELRDMLLKNGTGYDFVGVPNAGTGCHISYNFIEPWREDNEQLAISAFPTMWGGGKFPAKRLSTLAMEIDLGAVATPALQIEVETDDLVPDVETPSFIGWEQWTIPAASTKFDYTLRKNGELVAMTMYADSGGANQATHVQFQQNGETLHDWDYSVNYADLLQNKQYPAASGRTAKIYDIVFDKCGNLDRRVPLDNRTNILTIEAAAAMSGLIPVLAEVVIPII